MVQTIAVGVEDLDCANDDGNRNPPCRPSSPAPKAKQVLLLALHQGAYRTLPLCDTNSSYPSVLDSFRETGLDITGIVWHFKVVHTHGYSRQGGTHRTVAYRDQLSVTRSCPRNDGH